METSNLIKQKTSDEQRVLVKWSADGNNFAQNN